MASLRLFLTTAAADPLIPLLASWVNLPPKRPTAYSRRTQYWLAATKGFDTWVLFAFPWQQTDINPKAAHAVACLECAEEKNAPAIGDLLISAYEESLRPGGIVTIGTVDVPDLPRLTRVRDLGKMFPVDWSQLPAELETSFELSDGCGATDEMFERFACTDIALARRVVGRPRIPGLLVRYKVVAIADVVPVLPYILDAPLMALKGAQPQLRGHEDWGVMCKLYQHVRRRVGFGGGPAWSYPHSVRLAVAGRTAAECLDNWALVARGLRSVRVGRPVTASEC